MRTAVVVVVLAGCASAVEDLAAGPGGEFCWQGGEVAEVRVRDVDDDAVVWELRCEGAHNCLASCFSYDGIVGEETVTPAEPLVPGHTYEVTLTQLDGGTASATWQEPAS